MESTIYDFKCPVHRCIIKRKLYFGLPLKILLGLILVIVFFVLELKMIAFIPIMILIWFILKSLTDKDEFMIELFLSNLLQPEKLS